MNSIQDHTWARPAIPLVMIGAALGYCWAVILDNHYIPDIRHKAAVVLFILLILFFFAQRVIAVIGTGVFLILGTVHIISISPVLSITYLKIFGVSTPKFQLLSFGLLPGWFFINRSSV
jgi:hypothetical protein